jgi:hypothetical protein
MSSSSGLRKGEIESALRADDQIIKSFGTCEDQAV